MAFKTKTFSAKIAQNPAIHFKTLTKRHFPDVMPHQKEILELYAEQYENSSDVALQLPTGSGKTLVGLLIADWRRSKLGDRVVYLCPTKQLVRQTVLQARDQYGIDVVDLSGRKSDFAPADRADYKTGAKVAVSTYSGLFNTNPFFDDANLIIVDDAHAAENYIAKMWSLEIKRSTVLHESLSKFLASYIDAQAFSRMTGDWNGPADAMWVEKLPTPQVDQIAPELAAIIDSHATRDEPDLYYTWSILREHLDACHIYLGANEILIRPLIPPTSTHTPFNNASQRIFMSATLGSGGDLERLSGRRKIDRLPAPEGFQTAGVGRRFFIFPTLSLTSEETDALRLGMQEVAGRSVILTPSTTQAHQHCTLVNEHLKGFQVFTSDDIEDDKKPFTSTERAVAILANRYDGIDFPGNECRLLCVDDLPKAMNAQERFVMSKMGAAALYNDRVQTRVFQAMGRCTRALQDRSAVVVTGTELVDFLTDNRKWQYFPPELQAELKFGVDQSKEVTMEEIAENFEMFIENNTDWASADNMIRSAISDFDQREFPAMNELEVVVKQEIIYQEALWHQDYAGCLSACRSILGSLNHPQLRGYRALWHYLAGSAAQRLSASSGDAQFVSALEHYRQAKSAAPSVSWLNKLARHTPSTVNDDNPGEDEEVLIQIEAIERLFLTLGTATHHKFEKSVAGILSGLSDAKTFEASQVELGTLLGFRTGNDESDAAPDPWWLGDQVGIIFEDHAGGEASSIFSATKARQASSHPKWVKKKLSGTQEMNILPVIVTPCTKAKSGADPVLDDVYYWRLEDFVNWATHATNVLRELKGTFPGEGDLAWRAEAGRRLEAEQMTMQSILDRLPIASRAMEIVP